MKVTRLAWAGCLLEHRGRHLVIDPLGRSKHLRGLMGRPGGDLPSVAGLGADAALVTHRHPDHFDPPSLHQALAEGVVVHCPARLGAEVEEADLEAREVEAGASFRVAGFRVAAARARTLRPRFHAFHVDMGHTAVTVRSGERLRLDVASAASPEVSRDLDTGDNNEVDTGSVVAHQTIHHDSVHPSHHLLPVDDLPSDGG